MRNVCFMLCLRGQEEENANKFVSAKGATISLKFPCQLKFDAKAEATVERLAVNAAEQSGVISAMRSDRVFKSRDGNVVVSIKKALYSFPAWSQTCEKCTVPALLITPKRVRSRRCSIMDKKFSIDCRPKPSTRNTSTKQ